MRNEFNETDKTILINASNRIKDFTDFGLEVWAERLKQHPHDTYDLPSNLLFRQILEAGDGIFELIRIGCINASKPLLRVALDCYLQLAFLLEKDEKRRASHFLYHYNRNRLYYLERVLNPEHENSLDKKLADDDVMNGISLTDEEKKAGLVDYNTLKEIINSNENAEVANEYGTKRKQTWYQIFINSFKIEDLAKALKRSAMYEIVFKNLSSFIHGEDIIHSNIIFKSDESIEYKILRDPTQLDFIVANSIIILRRTILLFIQVKMNNSEDLAFRLKQIHEKNRKM